MQFLLMFAEGLKEMHFDGFSHLHCDSFYFSGVFITGLDVRVVENSGLSFMWLLFLSG